MKKPTTKQVVDTLVYVLGLVAWAVIVFYPFFVE